jgi:hypothetical protein
MNRNLKFAIAAAIASLGVTGQAHALTQSTSSTSGSLFLYAFEDRVGTGSNPAATNSAIFDLGLASGFDATSNHTFDFSANSAWTSYIATIANPANIHWGVFGVANGLGSTGSTVLTTQSVVPASLAGGALQTSITNANFEIGTVYGTGCTSCGFNAVTANDLASTSWDDNAGLTALGTLTGNLGGSVNFYKYVSTGTKATNYATKTAFATGGDADYFTLSNNGVLTYTATAAAPVPEADSYAMMLAGLGLVGYMVRRRKAA